MAVSGRPRERPWNEPLTSARGCGEHGAMARRRKGRGRGAGRRRSPLRIPAWLFYVIVFVFTVAVFALMVWGAIQAP